MAARTSGYQPSRLKTVETITSFRTTLGCWMAMCGATPASSESVAPSEPQTDGQEEKIGSDDRQRRWWTRGARGLARREVAGREVFNSQPQHERRQPDRNVGNAATHPDVPGLLILPEADRAHHQPAQRNPSKQGKGG